MNDNRGPFRQLRERARYIADNGGEIVGARKFYLCLGVSIVFITIVIDQWLRGRMAEILPLLSGLKEIVVSAAAVTGAIIAVHGLDAWKRQLSGKTEYEVALRFLRAVYKLRDAIAVVRSPFMSAAEMAHALKESDPSHVFDGSPMDATNAAPLAYQQRWKQILESLSELQLVAQEAEVLWGDRVIAFLDPLRKCVDELRWALETHLHRKPPLSDKVHDLVFAGEDDKFAARVDEAVKAIEEFVRPHFK